MKKFVRVGVLCAAIAALALANVTGAGAGKIVESGEVVITPNPVEVGKTVTIANAPGDDSTCQSGNGPVVVELWVYSLETDAFEAYLEATPDDDGNWSTAYTIPNDDAAIGEWEVDAQCVYAQVQPAEFAEFLYPLAQFDVVGAETPQPPDDGTAPAEEVRTAPRFTG